jgi:hypothetical protein
MSSIEIPKIIWQTHEWAYEDLPQNFKATSMTWQNLNPGWEYRYVNAAEREHYVREADYLLYKMYKVHDKVSQADMWRYLVTHEFGGVYADMDSICTMSLDQMIAKYQNNAQLVALPPDGGNFVNNSNFAVTKQSQVMERILKNLVFYYEKTNWIQLYMHSDTVEEFWEQFAIGIKLHPGIFMDVVQRELFDLVSFNYYGAAHSEGFKTKFDYDFKVNYRGEPGLYLELADQFGWETHIPPLENGQGRICLQEHELAQQG